MKEWLRGFYYSFPIQLVFLHLRKYQVLLVFWFILFSTVNGSFMKGFGADSLYLSPEYLDQTNFLSAALVGISIGMFIMSWNISTFILFSRHFRFLSATTNPFLKYCINNSVIPWLFLLFYFFRAFQFTRYKALMGVPDILLLALGFIGGLALLLAISFVYFFRADRSILRRMIPSISNPGKYITHLGPRKESYQGESIIHVEWYFESFFRLRAARDVRHYTPEFVDSLFKRHHFAAILSVFAAFLLLVGVGFCLESPYFQIPAAASITMLFSILIGVAGAFSYFLQSWSIPYLIALMLLLNFFYKIDWIDPRNKGYGLNYNNKADRPAYTREGLLALCTKDKVDRDKANMIAILEKWKKKQDSDKPLLVLVNTSGGGHRSATFTMSVLQELDSLTQGKIMKNIFLINGASGGMIGATYFRELYRRKQGGEKLLLQDRTYVDDIAKDLLNPLFSSFVTRDLIAPAQKFYVNDYTYIKDRGYAFEEKLNKNTRGFLDKQLRDYTTDETEANIPLIFYNSVVTRDSRKLLISTQPVSFMMQGWQDTTRMPEMDPDVVDFNAFFAKQDPTSLRVLSALRMNATFPIVLPNVWLPSEPVIDVMDAGLRDNYGQETTLRFLETFDEWITANTSGVLLVQIRDRSPGGWEYPYLSDDITDHATKPFLLLQHNWFKMMEYFQNDMLSYYASDSNRVVHKVLFQYAADKEENKAALNFHLSPREKLDIMSSVNSVGNRRSFAQLMKLLPNKETP
ncbi:MAG: patatin-like phospholipase family protein [Chitinophagaceae bacterium]|nr:MAG: patatin-like phospholipase family protein [Chitinophagaceae bacterium]